MDALGQSILLFFVLFIVLLNAFVAFLCKRMDVARAFFQIYSFPFIFGALFSKGVEAVIHGKPSFIARNKAAIFGGIIFLAFAVFLIYLVVFAMQVDTTKNAIISIVAIVGALALALRIKRVND
ncbi:MAG: hypothetical protein ABIA93_00890 [Candidatus Woesearchaeota archaeon]